MSYSDVKKTAGIATSTPAIVSKHVGAVDVQPSRLPPAPPQTTVTRIPVGDSRPVAIASADAAAVKSMPVPATAPAAEAVTSMPAPSQHADDHQPSRLITKRSQSCSNGARIYLIMAISPPRAYFFAVRPRRAAPKAPSCSEQHLIRLNYGGSVRLARDRIWPRRANGISVPPSSAQVPLRSNWRTSRTVIEVTMFVDAKVRMYGVFARRCPCSIA